MSATLVLRYAFLSVPGKIRSCHNANARLRNGTLYPTRIVRNALILTAGLFQTKDSNYCENEIDTKIILAMACNVGMYRARELLMRGGYAR